MGRKGRRIEYYIQTSYRRGEDDTRVKSCTQDTHDFTQGNKYKVVRRETTILNIDP